MTKPFRPFFLIIIIKNERFFPVCNRNPKWTTKAKKHPNECSNFGKRKRKNNCNMVCSLITKPCYGFQFPIRKCRIRRFVFFFQSLYAPFVFALFYCLIVGLKYKIWNLDGWMKRNACDHRIFIRTIRLNQILSFFFFWSHSPGVLELFHR